MKHLTKLGKDILTFKAGCIKPIEYRFGVISESELSSSLEDYNWLTQNIPALPNKKVGRFKVEDIIFNWTGIGDFALILRDGHLFEVDDNGSVFEDDENETGCLYSLYELLIHDDGKNKPEVCSGEIENLKGDQYVNIIADEDSSLFSI
jgi:hypothetical protein